ncbi:Eukaryotic translation initiation factor 5B [Nymphaea thermarum]|nr:Eukaryotic translation initiation factor 5B [Nymphaea thermarum]
MVRSDFFSFGILVLVDLSAMGRKKPTAGADEEEPPVRVAPVGKKNRKKDHVIDDDEYSVATELTDDQEQASMAEKSVNEKHQVGQKIDEFSGSADDLALSNRNQKDKKDKKLPIENNEEKETGKKKGKKGKKDFKVDDDEFEIGDSVKSVSIQAEEAETEIKKGKKGKKDPKVDDHKFDIDDSVNSALVQGEEAETGKKKGKKDFKADDNEFDIGDSIKSESMQGEEENFDDSFAGKKKKKSKEKASKLDVFSLLASYEGEDAGLQEPSLEEKRVEVDDESDDIVFTGKKKKKGSKAKATEALEVTATSTTSDIEFSSRVLDETTASSKSTISESSEKLKASTVEEKSLEEEDDEPTIIFSGKKKSKSKKGSMFSSTGFGTIPVEEETSATAQVPAIDNKGEVEFGSTAETQGSNDQPDSGLTSKKQKKKKKSGRTAQEEEDLEKILAELGEVPPSTKPAPAATKDECLTHGTAPLTTGSGEVEAGTGPTVTIDAEEPEESAAAKKKKKKKEKEKEKKAAAAASAAGVDEQKAKIIKEEAQDIKSKISDKKVPKHVREMQERLARLKEAEEKKKREEEERLRKEEEERLRLEELERQKEEAKRRKKEREKEKLQKKKQEGKLLTGKQKEEARRLALMREQFLSQSGLPTENTGVPKKPRYESKKKKPVIAQVNDSLSEKVVEVEEAVDDQHIVPKPEQLDADKIENEPPEGENVDELDNEPEEENDAEEDEDEWDAKSWDEDVVLPGKSAFSEEESDPMVKKATKRVMGPSDSTSSKVMTAHSSSIKDGVSSAATSKVNVGIERGVENHGEAVETNKRKDTAKTRENRKEEALAKKSSSDLRSPICCILGHVDTGKTKLLDCIRRTNVQEGEAGGITQQIGATYFPMENIRERTKELKATAELRVPGLLVIDTPGHESFTNLRSRGSSLCDIAILVIDIMHGLEPQTIESLNLLKFRKTPFVVALNKVDRLYGWKSIPNGPIQKALKQQSKDVNVEFETRLSQIVMQLKEQGLNSELYYKNKEVAKYVSIVPTSAISGEGIPDLLMLLVQLTQKRMEERLMFISEIECTVLEVKVIEGLGTTIDVVLVNGVLHEGDQIVVCGMQGPIVTNIRALLTPHPMKELRVKGTYQHHKELKAAQGIKITAQGLEHAIAGTQLYVVGPDDDLEEIKEEAIIASIEDNHKDVESAKKGQKVAVKIVGSNPEESQKMFGRHFSIEDELVSQISRRSIDVLKENYRSQHGGSF